MLRFNERNSRDMFNAPQLNKFQSRKESVIKLTFNYVYFRQ